MVGRIILVKVRNQNGLARPGEEFVLRPVYECEMKSYVELRRDPSLDVQAVACRETPYWSISHGFTIRFTFVVYDTCSTLNSNYSSFRCHSLQSRSPCKLAVFRDILFHGLLLLFLKFRNYADVTYPFLQVDLTSQIARVTSTLKVLPWFPSSCFS